MDVPGSNANIQVWLGGGTNLYVRKQRSRNGDFGLELCQCWEGEEGILNIVLHRAKTVSDLVRSSQKSDILTGLGTHPTNKKKLATAPLSRDVVKP